MKTVTMKQKDKYRQVGKIDLTNVSYGHQNHKSGSGEHQDKRDRRNRTRSNQFNTVMKDYD